MLSAFKKVSHSSSSVGAVFSCREEHEPASERAGLFYKYDRQENC